MNEVCQNSDFEKLPTLSAILSNVQYKQMKSALKINRESFREQCQASVMFDDHTVWSEQMARILDACFFLRRVPIVLSVIHFWRLPANNQFCTKFSELWSRPKSCFQIVLHFALTSLSFTYCWVSSMQLVGTVLVASDWAKANITKEEILLDSIIRSALLTSKFEFWNSNSLPITSTWFHSAGLQVSYESRTIYCFLTGNLRVIMMNLEFLMWSCCRKRTMRKVGAFGCWCWNVVYFDDTEIHLPRLELVWALYYLFVTSIFCIQRVLVRLGTSTFGIAVHCKNLELQYMTSNLLVTPFSFDAVWSLLRRCRVRNQTAMVGEKYRKI